MAGGAARSRLSSFRASATGAACCGGTITSVKLSRWLALVAVALVMSACSASPSHVGTVTGRILYVAGWNYPGPGEIRLLDVFSKREIIRKVGQDGNYVISDVPAGTYRVSCAPPGPGGFIGADWGFRPIYVLTGSTTKVNCVFVDHGEP